MRHLLAPPLDLVMPVGRTLLLEPPERPAHFRLDRAQGPERVLAVKRQRNPEVLQLIDGMDRGLRAHGDVLVVKSGIATRPAPPGHACMSEPIRHSGWCKEAGAVDQSSLADDSEE